MHLHRTFWATAALACATPATALAEDFCVANAAGCSGTAVTAIGLKASLTAAESNGTDDRFFLPAGTIATLNSFSYASPEKVEIIGKGANASKLRGMGAGPAVTLAGNPDSVVTDLSIEATDNATIGLALSAARASRIGFVQGANPNLQTGVTLEQGARMDHANVAVHGSIFGVLVRENGGSGTVTDSTIASPDYMGFVSGAKETTLRRSTVRARYGIVLGVGHATVSDTLVDLRNQAGPAHGIIAMTQVIAPHVDFVGDIERVTIVGDSPTATDQIGLAAAAEDVDSATLNVRDVVISGIGVPVGREAVAPGVANVKIDHSVYPPAVAGWDLGPGAITESARRTVSPGFVDAAGGDFRLSPTSALVDTGSPGTLPDGAADRDGASRAADGDGDCVARTDVGAFELQKASPPSCSAGPPSPPPPAPTPAPAPTAPAAPSSVSTERAASLLTGTALVDKLSRPAVTKLSVGDRVVRFRLSRPATVRLTFAKRARNGRYRTVRTVKRLAGRQGANTVGHRVGRGTYRVTVTAQGGSTASKRFTVKSRRAAVARAAVAGPVVSGLKVRKRDNALVFSLSEAAGLKITFAKKTRSGSFKTIEDIEGIPGDAGPNTITHRLELGRGTYRATVTPIAPAGPPASRTFTVKRKV